jgi:hypothetical protein
VKPEHDERFRRIVEDYLERPVGDYAELLRGGQVSSPDGVDADQWRAEIRAKARADKIRVITIRDGDRAIAARQQSIPKDQELAELTRELDRSVVLRGLAERARQFGHEIGSWLRHDEENIAVCTSCAVLVILCGCSSSTRSTWRRWRRHCRGSPSIFTCPRRPRSRNRPGHPRAARLYLPDEVRRPDHRPSQQRQ